MRWAGIIVNQNRSINSEAGEDYVNKIATNHFQGLNEYVYQIQQEIGATAAAVYIIQNNRVVNEWYSGTHEASARSRIVDEKTQFNVASIRKTYLALAVSLLMAQGKISSVDDEIGHYLNEYKDAASGVTLRHLLTHSHGLIEENGKLEREFPAGYGWAYRNMGIAMLIQLVRHISGQSLSSFMKSQVFNKYGLEETGWRTNVADELIYNYYEDQDTWVGPNNSDAGDQSNLFVSARDLAMWGYLHLKDGCVNGERRLPESVFARVSSLHTPVTVPSYMPRNSFIWWLQNDTHLIQIGEQLPSDTYQVLGITGCACLVIPSHDAVVVRMYNQLSNSNGYDYLNDIRKFGNIACDLLSSYE